MLLYTYRLLVCASSLLAHPLQNLLKTNTQKCDDLLVVAWVVFTEGGQAPKAGCRLGPAGAVASATGGRLGASPKVAEGHRAG